MRKFQSTTNLTETQIRMLLREKLRQNRRACLERYRKTGRVITLVPDMEPGNGIPSAFEVTELSHEFLSQSPSQSKIRTISYFLGYLEVGSILGIVALLWMAWQGLSGANQQASAAWVFPTPTATPIIQAVVLPDGHTPPDRAGRSQPNEKEVPEHLRPIVQARAVIPTPTAAPQHGVRIQVPALNIDAPIVQGDGWEQLMKGVGQHLGTANPGEKGNMVLSGHNDVYGEVFRYLDRLKAGDEIIVFTFTRQYTYIVEGWTLVNPDQFEVMNPTPDETLTLISCYPYLVDTQRIVVKARLLK